MSMRWTLPWALGLAVATAAPIPAAAQRLESIFERGNQAYFQGDFDGAVRDYELLVDAGIEDPDVCFNLATAYGRAGRYGQSIRWFERTLRLRPGDGEAELGLAQARAALGRRQAEATGEAMVETRPPFGESLVRPFSENALGWVVLALNLLLFGMLVAFPAVRAETGRFALGIAIPLTALLWLASGAGLAIKSGALRDGEPAIIISGETTLREGPDPRAVTRGSALEGERARVVDRHGDWVRLHLDRGREGWAPRGDVGEI